MFRILVDIELLEVLLTDVIASISQRIKMNLNVSVGVGLYI